MSFLSALARPFKRDVIRIVGSRHEELAAGVRDPSDSAHRAKRIVEHLAQTNVGSRARVKEIVEFLDLWLILETDAGWVPFPGWEGEPRARQTYSTQDAAKAAVASVGGTLRPGRLQSIK